MTTYINGRFLTQPLSGVQRYAREITRALDAELARSPRLQHQLGPIEVLLPHAVPMPDWQVLRPRVIGGGRGHLWEQGALWRASRDGVLISLGNAGPLRHRAHVLCLHDANLWEFPQAYGWRYRMLHRVLRPRLARRAAALMTVSRHSAQAIARHLGVDATGFRIVSNSADHVLGLPAGRDVPARYGLTPGGYLLSVGNRSPNKNLCRLIAAHAECGDRVPPLALVGGGVPGIVADTAGPGARVTTLGRVPDADLRGLYEGAAGFVFAALHEGFGIPPLEAMRLGVPVVCARSGAMPEVLGDAPLWFDPRDVGAMRTALMRFARMGSGARAAMIHAGNRQAALYNWRQSALALAETVGEVQRRGADDLIRAGALVPVAQS
jgi:glycosyltransferase involved in cell wall biosynthesis